MYFSWEARNVIKFYVLCQRMNSALVFTCCCLPEGKKGQFWTEMTTGFVQRNSKHVKGCRSSWWVCLHSMKDNCAANRKWGGNTTEQIISVINGLSRKNEGHQRRAEGTDVYFPLSRSPVRTFILRIFVPSHIFKPEIQEQPLGTRHFPYFI